MEISKYLEEVHATVLEQQEEKESVKIDLDSNDVQENVVEVSILAKVELEDIQVPSKKNKENPWLDLKRKEY